MFGRAKRQFADVSTGEVVQPRYDTAVFIDDDSLEDFGRDDIGADDPETFSPSFSRFVEASHKLDCANFVRDPAAAEAARAEVTDALRGILESNGVVATAPIES